MTLSPVINENESMRDVWFTADFHFGHFNIIRYCNRPFANSQEMDDVICERVNACAKPSDVLFFSGIQDAGHDPGYWPVISLISTTHDQRHLSEMAVMR